MEIRGGEINFIPERNGKSLLHKNDSERSSIKTYFNKFKLKIVLICNYKINDDHPCFASEFLKHFYTTKNVRTHKSENSGNAKCLDLYAFHKNVDNKYKPRVRHVCIFAGPKKKCTYIKPDKI